MCAVRELVQTPAARRATCAVRTPAGARHYAKRRVRSVCSSQRHASSRLQAAVVWCAGATLRLSSWVSSCARPSAEEWSLENTHFFAVCAAFLTCAPLSHAQPVYHPQAHSFSYLGANSHRHRSHTPACSRHTHTLWHALPLLQARRASLRERRGVVGAG
jgi:hypothetical protein